MPRPLLRSSVFTHASGCVHLATDLGHFVAVSTECQTESCKHFHSALYNDTSLVPFSEPTPTALLSYDTAAVPGRIGLESVIIGGLNVPNQTLVAINNFNGSNLFNGTAGILGLGFPVNKWVTFAR